jgi:twitching motility protein PilT
VLKAAISQRLMPRADGTGRVPAVEVMRTTNFIRDCVENKDKTKLIHDAIAQGTSQYGMQTFDQSIYQLYKKDLITMEEALRRATNPDEFKLKLAGIESTAEMAQREMESTLRTGFEGAAGGAAPGGAGGSVFEMSRAHAGKKK